MKHETDWDWWFSKTASERLELIRQLRAAKEMVPAGVGDYVHAKPGCPFMYCDQEAPFTACKERCRHAVQQSQGNSEEAAFHKTMSQPTEVWYPCGIKASAGAPLNQCPIHGPIAICRTASLKEAQESLA